MSLDSPQEAYKRAGELLADLNRIDAKIAKIEDRKAAAIRKVEDRFAADADELQRQRQELSEQLAQAAAAMADAAGSVPVSSSSSARLEPADPAAVLKALRKAKKGNASQIARYVPDSSTRAVELTLSALYRNGDVKIVEGSRGRYKQYESA